MSEGYKTIEEPPSVDEWQQAVDELKQVDQTIEELREELKQFELRRTLIASREALLRQRLAAAGKVVTPVEAASTRGSDASEASPTREPVIFNLDDEGASTKLQRPSSLEDWEQGLEMLNTAQTRDRQASLRAHWLLSGKNAANSPSRK
ncbi:Serine/threonine-protein kinase Nek10 [Durusdinium trenchii]|uniref:Serine/threonine-protein kinase Nek10 n=1 Tax=Durusdinium trenchii TaxID=1381693 RepID=A0ABP0ILZ1_9DINO